jgi:hypothetical protein
MENPFPFANEDNLNNGPTSSDTDSTTTANEVFDPNDTDSSVNDLNETASSTTGLQGKVKDKSSAAEDRCKVIEDQLAKMDFTGWASIDIIHACIDVWYQDMNPAAPVNDNTWANSEFADSSILELLSTLGDNIWGTQPEVSQGSGEMPNHWERSPWQDLSPTTMIPRREPRYINAFFGRDINKIHYYQGSAEFMQRRTMNRLDRVYSKHKAGFNERFNRATGDPFFFNMWLQRRRYHGKSRLWFENRYTA